MAGAPLSAHRGDLGLDFLRGERRQAQGIEFGEGFPKALRGGVASALPARFEEIDKILDFCTLLGRQRFQFLDQSLRASVHRVKAKPMRVDHRNFLVGAIQTPRSCEP
jgi:hypothetical protein